MEDVNQLYNKTSEKIGCWCLVIQNHGRTYYIELGKFFKEPKTIQHFVRERVVSRLSDFKEKTIDNIIWLCEAKVPSTEKKTEESSTVTAEESLLDKIKKTIENLMSSVKEKMEENKKKAKEAKSK